MDRNLSEGKITSSIIIFSLPMIVGNFFQQLYNVCDTLIVGKLIGAFALSAVGSSYALMVLISSILIGFCMGASILFSIYYGSKDISNMKKSIANAFFFILVITIIINALSFILLDRIIDWINIPHEAILMTKQYLRIIFCGIIFTFIYNFFTAILRSFGNTMIALIFLIISAIMNIFLDIFLIKYFNMGVSGAAIATLVSQGFSAISLALYFFIKCKEFTPKRKEMILDFKIIKKIVSYSSLTAIQQSIMNLGILMVQGLVNSFGVIVSAAFSAVVKIDAFAYMPAQDFGNAFSTFVAQNLGARKFKRIDRGLKIASTISASFCIIVSAFVCIFSDELMSFFISEKEVEVISIGSTYLKTEGIFYFAIAILFIWYGYFRGLAKAYYSLILTLVSLGLRVFLAYTLSATKLGLLGIWISVPIGWLVADLLGFYYYKKYKRGKHEIKFE